MDLIPSIAAGTAGVLAAAGIKHLYDTHLRKIRPNKQGKKELRGNIRNRYIGLTLWGVIGSVWACVIYYKDGEMILGALGCTVLLGLFACYFFWLYNNDKVVLDKEEITIYGRRGSTVTLKWEEISDIFYDRISGDICLKYEGGEASFHHMIVGINEFFEEMERQTKWKLKDLGFPFTYEMY